MVQDIGYSAIPHMMTRDMTRIIPTWLHMSPNMAVAGQPYRSSSGEDFFSLRHILVQLYLVVILEAWSGGFQSFF